MSEYKEFGGKTLDEAIEAACVYYDAPREKLEIEIVSDAKTGIFGLVGARKASVRARLVRLEHILDDLDGPAAKQPRVVKEKASASAPAEQASGQAHAGRAPRPADADGRGGRDAAGEASPAPEGQRGGGRGKLPGARTAPPKQGGSRQELPASSPRARRQANEAPEQGPDAEEGADDLPRLPIGQLDQDVLLATTREIIERLVGAIVGEMECTVQCAEDRVRVSIATGDDAGPLIGKDGQTLNALQYLAARMLSHKMGAWVRVQVDAGAYRERQDERLRDMAVDLAAKVKANKRPQLTSPLTSYQRRIIHVALQDDPQIQTHSKGDGDLKRVVVALRRRQDS